MRNKFSKLALAAGLFSYDTKTAQGEAIFVIKELPKRTKKIIEDDLE